MPQNIEADIIFPKLESYYHLTASLVDYEGYPLPFDSSSSTFYVGKDKKTLNSLKTQLNRKISDNRLIQEENEDIRKKLTESYRDKRLHEDIFKFNEDYLDPLFLDAVRNGTLRYMMDKGILKRETDSNIYSLRIFKEDFLQKVNI
jgi:regulator of replication initiation timing